MDTQGQQTLEFEKRAIMESGNFLICQLHVQLLCNLWVLVLNFGENAASGNRVCAMNGLSLYQEMISDYGN